MMLDYRLILFVAALAGCAAHPDPIVDVKVVKNCLRGRGYRVLN